MSFAQRHSWRRPALVALLPAAIVLVLIAVLFRAGPHHFLPVWTDEVAYWNEAAVFAEAGVEGGYTTVHEQTARAGWSRFGAHGPIFAAFHGSIGRVLGWHPSSAFFINLAVVSLAAFTWLRGSAAGVSPASILLVAAFWPLLLYLPTNMQEPTHFALAFLFALAIERQRDGGGAWTALLLVVAALIRPSWAFLLLPLGWRRARRAGPWGVAALVGLTLVAAAAAYGTFDVLASSGYQNNLRRVAAGWDESPGRALAMIGDRASANLRLLFARTEDEPPELVLRYFIALFVLVLSIRCLAARPSSPWWKSGVASRRASRVAGKARRPRIPGVFEGGATPPARMDRPSNAASLPPRAAGAQAHADALDTALLALAPVLGVVLIFGEVESWRDFRVLAPHVLVALLLVAADARWERWLWAGTLVFLPVYHQGFVEFHEERFTADRRGIAAMREATAETMAFVPGAPPWTNTVNVPAELLQFPLLGLPRGIGVSYVVDWSDVTPPVRAEYVLLRPGDREEVEPLIQLVPLAETPLGTLYRNAGPATAAR